MPDPTRPLVLIVRHVGAEPEVIYDENDVDIWFADSTFAHNHYGSVQAQLDDINDLATDADDRGELEIAERLRSLATWLKRPTGETVYRTREAALAASQDADGGA